MLSQHHATGDESLTSTVNDLQKTTVELALGPGDWSAAQRDSETADGHLVLPASAERPVWCSSCGGRVVDLAQQHHARANSDPENHRAGKSWVTHATAPETLTLSISEAAHLLGIGVSTAYRLCARGEFPIPVLRIGGIVKVSLKRLHDYVDADGEAES
jgi:excisionase family DNA binding protein